MSKPFYRSRNFVFLLIIVLVASGVTIGLVVGLNPTGDSSLPNGDGPSYNGEQPPPEPGWWDNDPIVSKCRSNIDTVLITTFDELGEVVTYNVMNREIWYGGGSIPPTKPNWVYSDFLKYVKLTGSFTSLFGGSYTEAYSAHFVESFVNINNKMFSGIGISIETGEFIVFRHQELEQSLTIEDYFGGPTTTLWEGDSPCTVGDYVIFKPLSGAADEVYITQYQYFDIVNAGSSGEFTRCRVVLKAPGFEESYEGGISDYFSNVDCGV